MLRFLATLLMDENGGLRNNVAAYKIMLKFDGYKFIFSLFLLIYTVLTFHFRSFHFALIGFIAITHAVIVTFITPKIKKEIETGNPSKKLNLYHVLALSSYWLQILFGLAYLELLWMG